MLATPLLWCRLIQQKRGQVLFSSTNLFQPKSFRTIWKKISFLGAKYFLNFVKVVSVTGGFGLPFEGLRHLSLVQLQWPWDLNSRAQKKPWKEVDEQDWLRLAASNSNKSEAQSKKCRANHGQRHIEWPQILATDHQDRCFMMKI